MKFQQGFIILLALLTAVGCATRKNIRKGDQLVDEGSYYNAIDYYKEAHEKKPNNTTITHQLAEANFLMRDYAEAEKWYEKTLDMNAKAWTEDRIAYGQVLKANGKYEEALEQFNLFQDEYSGKDKSDFSRVVKNEIAGCELAISLEEEKKSAQVEHVDNGLNNTLQDYAPKYINEKKVLMAALLADEPINYDEVVENNEDYYTKMYFATLEEGAWKREMLPESINSSDMHASNGAFSEDGRTMYFTKCIERDIMKDIHCSVYMSEYNGSEWSDPVSLDRVNDEEYTTTHPAVGTDGYGNEVLYVVSDREGGKGGMDIWYSVKDADGNFSRPRNLGTSVNTFNDEVTPFYSVSDETFYFSSNGHPSVGGLDVFKIKGNVENWTSDVMNGGLPLNSGADDLYLALGEDGKHGYMVSNREGATSYLGSTTGDDVFSVRLLRDKVLKGYFASKKDTNEIPISGVSASLFENPEIIESVIAEVLTDDQPMYFDVHEGDSYMMNGTKEGYWPSTTNVSKDEILESGDTIHKLFYMEKVITRQATVKNVYFAFNQSDVQDQYKVELDSLFDLLQEYEMLVLQINGHTDSKGTEVYNEELGKKRALSAKKYLVDKKGLDEGRILVRSYGETSPLASNENQDGTDNPSGRAKNRRIEFRLLNDVNEELDIEIIYSEEGPSEE